MTEKSVKCQKCQVSPTAKCQKKCRVFFFFSFFVRRPGLSAFCGSRMRRPWRRAASRTSGDNGDKRLAVYADSDETDITGDKNAVSERTFSHSETHSETQKQTHRLSGKQHRHPCPERIHFGKKKSCHVTVCTAVHVCT